jgi:hypothetical protein
VGCVAGLVTASLLLNASGATAVGTPLWVWEYHSVPAPDNFHCAGLSNDVIEVGDYMHVTARTHGRKAAYCSLSYTNTHWAWAQLLFKVDGSSTWYACDSPFEGSAVTTVRVTQKDIEKCPWNEGVLTWYSIYTRHTAFGFATEGQNLYGPVGPYWSAG